MVKMFFIGLITGLAFGVILGFIIFCILNASKFDD